MVMDFKITKQVKKRTKRSSKLLLKLMVVLAVIFILLGIIFQNGYFLPAFLLAAFYYFYSLQIEKEYEYNFENEQFSIDVISGKRRRKTVHVLYYKNLEVVAPPDHEAVAKYRKGTGTEKIKKYDYTSYEDGIPYYTMIIKQNEEKIKLLLDLDEECLRFLKIRYPMKVFLQ